MLKMAFELIRDNQMEQLPLITNRLSTLVKGFQGELADLIRENMGFYTCSATPRTGRLPTRMISRLLK